MVAIIKCRDHEYPYPTGTSTDLVRQQVIRSFRGQRNLVLAALSGEEPPQAQRNAQRREGR